MIGYSGGSFDCLHVGHMRFLKECKNYCSYLVVSLNTDSFIERYKGKETLFSYQEREQHLLDSGYVDLVVENSGGEDSKPAIELVKPGIILIASDWAKKDYYSQMGFTQDWLDERHIALCYIPYYPRISTTKIRERVSEQHTT